VQSIANCKDLKITTQIIDGYFENENNLINKDFLKSALFFIACIKFPYWHKKKYFETIEIVKSYLKEI
jgi:hypothetical protein